MHSSHERQFAFSIFYLHSVLSLLAWSATVGQSGCFVDKNREEEVVVVVVEDFHNGGKRATCMCEPGSLTTRPVASVTTHEVKPGAHVSYGSNERPFTSRIAPRVRRIICITTASFSIGLSEQVLYTSRPLTFSKWHARSAIWICVFCKPSASHGVQVLKRCGAFRSVPSPEQTTSHNILSNRSVYF